MVDCWRQHCWYRGYAGHAKRMRQIHLMDSQRTNNEARGAVVCENGRLLGKSLQIFRRLLEHGGAEP